VVAGVIREPYRANAHRNGVLPTKRLANTLIGVAGWRLVPAYRLAWRVFERELRRAEALLVGKNS
jgi:hypothetical protein